MPNSDKNDMLLDSYPPFYRPNQHPQVADRSQNQNPPTPDSSDSVSIPVIDFQAMSPENLGRVCREWGMFRLVNHGVPVGLLTQLHEKAREIFNLGFESKQGLFTKPVLYFWGSPALSKSGTHVQETAAAGDNLSWLEGLNIPLDKTSSFKYQHPLLESFRSLLEEYGNHQTRLAEKIFNNIAQDLKLPPKKSESYLSTPSGFLRVYRYLRCPMADKIWGINAHSDSSLFSILQQDQVGGLQVNKNNEWIDVKPVFDTLIVNIGDMVQAMSNDVYPSAIHRVKVNREKERVSIGYFVFPEEDAVIESSNYKPFTFAEFQAEKDKDLKTVGKKIGLPRFRKDDNSPGNHATGLTEKLGKT